jgi:hypothetical protein
MSKKKPRIKNAIISAAEDVDLKKLTPRQSALVRQTPPGAFTFGNSVDVRRDQARSFFADPLTVEANYYGGGVKTLSHFYGRQLSYRILRRVSEKAWILNLCIQNLTKKIRPFLKPATQENQRGFRIGKKDSAEKKQDMTEAEKKTARNLEAFFIKTGDVSDEEREDDLDKYATKIIRDICQLDQIATELQRTRDGKVCAFWAIDSATIEVTLPESLRETGVKYVQVINRLPCAFYGKDDLLFDCMNPRTDIEKAGYGYSLVEQSIDLVTSSINTFMYNSGFFTENRLPRGILLLNGDADTEEIEDIEDYISNLLSGPPSSQWKVPIIPSGAAKNGESGGRKFEWVNLQGTNREMEFQEWFDLQLSANVAMFGLSMEGLGLHSQKSQPLIGVDASPKMEASKSLVLGDMLGFLQKHFNKILEYKNPDYEFEFTGYEKDDPKLIMDVDKNEVETYKTLNEKRAEKGMEAINFTELKNPADMPINSYTVQLFSNQKQGGESPFGDDGGGDSGQDEDDAGDSADEEDAEDGWGDIQVEKSLNKKSMVRITL